MIDFKGPLTPDREELVDANLGLIHYAIRRWYPDSEMRDMKEDDWQSGWTGLARATLDYDPDRARFSTYACGWIHSAIERGRRQAGLLRYNGNTLVDIPATASLEREMNSKMSGSGDGQRLKDRMTDKHSLWQDIRADEGSTLDVDEIAALEQIWSAAREADTPLLERIAAGRTIKAAGKDLGFCDSYGQKRVERLRKRMAS